MDLCKCYCIYFYVVVKYYIVSMYIEKLINYLVFKKIRGGVEGRMNVFFWLLCYFSMIYEFFCIVVVYIICYLLNVGYVIIYEI